MRLFLVAVANLATVTHGLELHGGASHVRSGALSMSLIDDIASKLPPPLADLLSGK